MTAMNIAKLQELHILDFAEIILATTVLTQ
jgi:hypothetical protein